MPSLFPTFHYFHVILLDIETVNFGISTRMLSLTKLQVTVFASFKTSNKLFLMLISKTSSSNLPTSCTYVSVGKVKPYLFILPLELAV